MEMEKVIALMQTLQENGFTGVENGFIRDVQYSDGRLSEYLEFLKSYWHGEGNCTTQGFGGYNLTHCELIWRKKVLETVLGKSMFNTRNLTVLSDEIFDRDTYISEIKGAPLTLLIKDSIIGGIANLTETDGIDEVFIPTISEELQNSTDTIEVVKAYEEAQKHLASLQEEARIIKGQIEGLTIFLNRIKSEKDLEEIRDEISQNKFDLELTQKEIETEKKKLANFETYASSHTKEIEKYLNQPQ